MKHLSSYKITSLAALAFGFTLLAGCGDDDSFSPVSKNRGYDYAYTSAKDLSKTPCDEMREGREAVIGRDKDRYECRFDRADSIYIWVGYDDTLTAEGLEFVRAESSSSSDEESSSSSRSSSSRSSSSSYSSSYSSSSARSSSSVRSSSSRNYSNGSYRSFLDSLESNEVFFNPDIDYGTMTDPRDGKTYRTVNVAGMTWMAENLNFIDSVRYPLSKEYSLCYGGDKKNCELLGRLYGRAGAMNDESCVYGSWCNLDNDTVQGICPDGWHIPTQAEAYSLVNYVGRKNAEKVMSANGWGNDTTGRINGEDTYGLSFVGTGSWNPKDGYTSKGLYTQAWIYANATTQYYLLIRGYEGEMYVNTYSDYELYYPVRCLKDNPATSSSSISSSSVSSSSMSSSSYFPPDKPSSAIEFNVTTKDDIFNPEIDYGEMIDPRDGKKYKTVMFAGREWMAENLNYADSAESIVIEGNTHCYDDDERNCELFGRFYNRTAAMNDDICIPGARCSLGDDPVQGICPDDWHIPSWDEAYELVEISNGHHDYVRSANGWGNGEEIMTPGLDIFGLSFVGIGSYFKGVSSSKGFYSSVWAVSEGANVYLLIQGVEQKMYVNNLGLEESSDYFFGVRCIKD